MITASEFADRMVEELDKVNRDWFIAHCHEELVFSDPFSRLHGPSGYRVMLDDVHERCHDLSFTWLTRLDEPEMIMGRWAMEFAVRTDGKRWSIEGMSELTFKDGKLWRHRDHWDPGQQIFMKLPVAKFIWQKAYGRLALSDVAP
ncbi:MAG TPA: hypothetical protein DHV03_07575 [Alphaproteobacteria bacterium]|nr:hypothetical protein [Paracoccaceae bacterium]RCL81166.1 MAG: nuclear transport factor 2 family protein [SAR116 cluster bacterium]RPH14282.1 MAG: nuclear transport factor 2 family protein [Alphaproteobacteria bacterium TMED150]HCJ62584.1 hypothetical protein [Alphaproteobacteria bacterium]HCY48529.1 hypothetical protein [Alphaproteobacteria bacterium]|tara:strand:- start:963 stop:1397 length:435 start_codon:yes stop_codon:yes gene_type:complete